MKERLGAMTTLRPRNERKITSESWQSRRRKTRGLKLAEGNWDGRT